MRFVVFLLLLIVSIIFPLSLIITIPVFIFLKVDYANNKKKHKSIIEDHIKDMSIAQILTERDRMELIKISPYASDNDKIYASFFVKYIQDNFISNGFANFDLSKCEQSTPIIQIGNTLHDAIVLALKEEGVGLTAREIADIINMNKTYIRDDNRPIPPTQISARINQYSHLFLKDESCSPMRFYLK